MSGGKKVSVTCNFRIESNPVDFIEESKKGLFALRQGVEQTITNEIGRLKRIDTQAKRVNGIAGSDLNNQTAMLLDYLTLQLHLLFPEKHMLPSVSYSAPQIRIAGKTNGYKLLPTTNPKPRTRKIPRKYMIYVLGAFILFVFGIVVFLLWFVFWRLI